MIRAGLLSVILTVAIVYLCPAADEAKPNITPASVFARLKTLVGDWEHTSAKGQTLRVNFRLTAADTVLVETWTMVSGRESMTLYHMDGDTLLVTHYCPQGNQPRLAYVPDKDASRHSFKFKDGTNLRKKDGFHQHAFWIELRNENSFSRAEKYVKNELSDEEAAKVAPDEPNVFTRAEKKDK